MVVKEENGSMTRVRGKREKGKDWREMRRN